MINEVDIYFSNEPKVLLSNYSIPQIEAIFGPLDDQTFPEFYSLDQYNSYLDRFIYDLWRKYGRIGLIEGQLYDYVQQRVIPVSSFKTTDYSVMALQKLHEELVGRFEWITLDLLIINHINDIVSHEIIVEELH